jgi:hypothetical protein
MRLRVLLPMPMKEGLETATDETGDVSMKTAADDTGDVPMKTAADETGNVPMEGARRLLPMEQGL